MANLAPFPGSDRVADDVKLGVAKFIERQNQPFTEDLRTEYGELDIEEELDYVLEFATEDVNGQIAKEEHNQRDIAGPYSLRSAWNERLDGFTRYGKSGTFNTPIDVHRASIANLEPTWPKITPASLETSADALPKTTQRGLPYWSNQPESDPQYLELAKVIADPLPFVPGWRGQPRSRTETSQRGLWISPRHVAILEGRVVLPLQQAAASSGRPEFAAWGTVDQLRTVMRDAVKLSSDLNLPMYSTDFSGFDASMDATFVTHMLEFAWSRAKRNRLLDTQLEVVYRQWFEGLITLERYYEIAGGIKSGMRGTSLIGTLGHQYSWHVVAQEVGAKILFVTTLGDDGVTILDKPIPLDEIADVMKQMLGLTLNETKTSEGIGECHYLQYLFDEENDAVRSLVRVANGVMRRERRPGAGWSRALRIVRALSQLQNAERHPNFVKMCEWFKPREEYLSRYSVQQIFQMAGDVSKQESLLGLAGFEHGRARLRALPKSYTAQVIDSI